LAQRYSSQTFIAAADRLYEICAWLDGLGLRHSPTRVGKYRRIFADLTKCQTNDTFEKFFEAYTLESFVNAAQEIAEIARIYEGLGQSSDPQLVPRLRKALRGHELHVLDDDARSGRDFSFELDVASKVARAGLPVDFGHEADLRTDFEGYEFFVECKRPRSAGQVVKRIEDGLKQLRTRFETSDHPDHARGVLALNISKLLNTKCGVLRADDPHALGEAAGQYTVKFVADYCAAWQTDPDPRFLGTLVVFDVVGIVGATERLDTCHDVGFSDAGHPAEFELFLRFGARAFGRPPNR
jgi:hypothetical protein